MTELTAGQFWTILHTLDIAAGEKMPEAEALAAVHENCPELAQLTMKDIAESMHAYRQAKMEQFGIKKDKLNGK